MVRPDNRLPTLSWFPGARPIPFASAAALGKAATVGPTSARMVSATRVFTPGRLSRSSRVAVKGASRVAPSASKAWSWVSRASTCRSCACKRKRGCAPLGPVRAATRSVVEARPRSSANAASAAGSVIPSASAARIRVPETPRTSLRTDASLLWAPSHPFWIRLGSRARSSMTLLR